MFRVSCLVTILLTKFYVLSIVSHARFPRTLQGRCYPVFKVIFFTSVCLGVFDLRILFRVPSEACLVVATVSRREAPMIGRVVWGLDVLTPNCLIYSIHRFETLNTRGLLNEPGTNSLSFWFKDSNFISIKFKLI